MPWLTNQPYNDQRPAWSLIVLHAEDKSHAVKTIQINNAQSSHSDEGWKAAAEHEVAQSALHVEWRTPFQTSADDKAPWK